MIGTTSSNISNSTAIIDEFYVKVIDYDGTIIDERYMHNKEIYTLPTPPTHQGLVFQEWSCTTDIVNNQIIINDNNVMIGAIYTTDSGQSEFDIELTISSGKSVTLNMNGTKDWGDGTSNTNTTHTYSSYGEYTIKCDGDTINSTNGLFEQYSNSNYYVKNVRLTNIKVIKEYSFRNCYSLRTITLSNDITNIRYYSFETSGSLRCLIIPNSIITLGNGIFDRCTSLIYAIIPNSITTIPTYTFEYCNCLKDFVISDNVVNIDNYNFNYCNSLTNIIIPNNVESASYAFGSCSALRKVKLSKKMNQIPPYIFSTNYALKTIIFSSALTKINAYAFNNCYSMTYYDFSLCTSVPELPNINAFNNINKICKIKVPFNLYYDWINTTNWDVYKYYLISTAYATINFTGDNTGNIYVNDNLISSTTTTWGGNTIPYYVYDSTNNIVLPTQVVTGITENSTQNINIDLSTKKKITLQTGISGLNVIFIIENKTYNATEDNGDYYIYVVGSNVNITYFIYGGDNYFNESGTIITTGSNITESITLTPATTQSFTRPDLTENGTLGGNSFAVSAESYSASYPAWRAVDSNTSTSYYWQSRSVSSDPNPSYIFYNPNELKVTELTYKYVNSGSTVYKSDGIVIKGSNDGILWIDIQCTYAHKSGNVVYTSTLTGNYYKYYKLIFNPNNSYVRMYDLLITATAKISI